MPTSLIFTISSTNPYLHPFAQFSYRQPILKCSVDGNYSLMDYQLTSMQKTVRLSYHRVALKRIMGIPLLWNLSYREVWLLILLAMETV